MCPHIANHSESPPAAKQGFSILLWIHMKLWKSKLFHLVRSFWGIAAKNGKERLQRVFSGRKPERRPARPSPGGGAAGRRARVAPARMSQSKNDRKKRLENDWRTIGKRLENDWKTYEKIEEWLENHSSKAMKFKTDWKIMYNIATMSF